MKMHWNIKAVRLFHDAFIPNHPDINTNALTEPMLSISKNMRVKVGKALFCASATVGTPKAV